MYQKYQTEALVLGSREQGEADKVFALYTREFGFVRARASSVRSEKSKMRYALQKFSRASVSLVKGKRGWRVAGASAIKGASGDIRGVGAFARVAELVLRLVHGEEKNEYLFAIISEAHDALVQENCEASATIEIISVARVLYALGYISNEALSMALFTHTAYTSPALEEAQIMKDKLLTSINKAIAETHL